MTLAPVTIIGRSPLHRTARHSTDLTHRLITSAAKHSESSVIYSNKKAARCRCQGKYDTSLHVLLYGGEFAQRFICIFEKKNPQCALFCLFTCLFIHFCRLKFTPPPPPARPSLTFPHIILTCNQNGVSSLLHVC